MNRQELALRLDEIDPDWIQKFLTTDAAARFYRDELEPPPRPGLVIHSSAFEPPTLIDAWEDCDCDDPFCEMHDEAP